MTKKQKIWISSISAFSVLTIAIAAPVAVMTASKSNDASTTNKTATSNVNNNIYNNNGPILMRHPASFIITTNGIKKITDSEIEIYADQLTPRTTITLNSNISSTSKASILYSYYATSTKPYNLAKPLGGVCIAKNVPTSSLQLTSLLVQKYAYWYVIATQTVNGQTYSLTTNTTVINVLPGPITVSLTESKINNPLSNELVAGFPTLVANVTNETNQNGTATYAWYGTNQNTNYSTTYLLNKGSVNSYTLNTNDWRAQFAYYFVQVTYTLNNKVFYVNSNFFTNPEIKTVTPISSNTLSISNTSINIGAQAGLPVLTAKTSSTLQTTNTTNTYTWYATNQDNTFAGLKLATTNVDTYQLTNSDVQTLMNDGYDYIYCVFSQTNGSQTYQLPSNDIQISFVNTNPLSQTTPVNQPNITPNIPNNTNPTTAQPTNKNNPTTPSNSSNPTSTKNTKSTNGATYPTKLFLNHQIELSSLKFTNNNAYAGLINTINDLYSSTLMNSIITNQYNQNAISISNVIYNTNLTDIISFTLTNKSADPVQILNDMNQVLDLIAPNQSETIQLNSANYIPVISNLSAFQNENFTYNLQTEYNTGKNSALKTYYNSTEYLADGYAYLYPMVWTQENDNCLSYSFSHAEYLWNQNTGPDHAITITQTTWTSHIKATANYPVIHMDWIGDILGLNNNLNNLFEGYKAYVPNNNNNNSIIISAIELNGAWYNVQYLFNGGSKFYIG